MTKATKTAKKPHKVRYNTDPEKKAQVKPPSDPNKLFQLGFSQGILDGFNLRKAAEERADAMLKRAEAAEAELKRMQAAHIESVKRVSELEKSANNFAKAQAHVVEQARTQERQQRVHEADQLSTSLASLRSRINEATELAMKFSNAWQGEIAEHQTQSALESLHQQATRGPVRTR